MAKAKLTAKQTAFIREYLLCRNATEAARKAGYTGSDETIRQTASQNLTHPHIAAAIEEHERLAARKFEIDHERIIRGLAAIAYFDPADVLEWGPKGIRWKSIKDIPEHARIALDIWGSPGVKGKGSVSLRNIPRDRALEILGKAGGMFKDGRGGNNQDGRRAALARIQAFFQKNRRDGSGSGT